MQKILSFSSFKDSDHSYIFFSSSYRNSQVTFSKKPHLKIISFQNYKRQKFILDQRKLYLSKFSGSLYEKNAWFLFDKDYLCCSFIMQIMDNLTFDRKFQISNVIFSRKNRLKICDDVCTLHTKYCIEYILMSSLMQSMVA